MADKKKATATKARKAPAPKAKKAPAKEVKTAKVVEKRKVILDIDRPAEGLAVMGQSVVKKDAVDKALGLARYAADIELPNMLWGGVFRSTIAHGYVKKFDASKALKIPGVACVLTYKDIPGKNRIGIILKDEFLCAIYVSFDNTCKNGSATLDVAFDYSKFFKNQFAIDDNTSVNLSGDSQISFTGNVPIN